MKKDMMEIFPNFFDKDISESAIRAIIEEYDIEKLKDMVKGLYLDPIRRTVKWKNEEKLIEFILETRKNLMIKFE